MAYYVKHRIDLFHITAGIGGVASAVILYIFESNLWKWALISYHNRVVAGTIVFFIDVLPILVLYIVLYSVNECLIRLFGANELRERQSLILQKLARAAISERAVIYEVDDLVDEVAWAKLSSYWRRK